MQYGSQSAAQTVRTDSEDDESKFSGMEKMMRSMKGMLPVYVDKFRVDRLSSNKSIRRMARLGLVDGRASPVGGRSHVLGLIVASVAKPL